MITLRGLLIGAAATSLAAAPIGALAFWLLLVQPFLP